MGRRRKTREVALQFLYQLDLHSADDPARHEAEFWSRHPVDEDTRVFGDALVRGTKANQGKIDQILSQFAEHWDLERMAVVDRNILRLAVYELLWTEDVPPKVAIKTTGQTSYTRSTNLPHDQGAPQYSGEKKLPKL